jgi:hypothetical protein
MSPVHKVKFITLEFVTHDAKQHAVQQPFKTLTNGQGNFKVYKLPNGSEIWILIKKIFKNDWHQSR